MSSESLSEWSLWLEPVQNKNVFEQINRDLAAVAPTSPSFAPHITVLGGIPLAIGLNSIRADLRVILARLKLPQRMTLSTASPIAGESYFKSVLAPIRPIPSELTSLREACINMWDKAASEYDPHLSLKYGDMHPDIRSRIVSQFSTRYTLPEQIVVDSISIVRCVGIGSDWQVVDTIALR